jgi:hypothetical protein
MGDFQSDYVVTANKTHKCCECRGQISKGQSYHRQAGAYDGSGYAYKTCNACYEVRNWLDNELRAGPFGLNHDEGIEFGGLRAELIEYLSEDRFESVYALRALLGMAERKDAVEFAEKKDAS